MRKPVLLAAGALALAGLLTPASAQTPLAGQQVFFHCPSQVKAINASPITDGAITTWDTTAPAASVQTGAGCGFGETGLLSGTGMQTIYDFPGEGSFTGDLDSLTLQFHVINGAPSRATGAMTLSLRLTVDGQSMFGTAASGESAPVTVPVTLKASATGASNLAEVTVTGLNFFDPEDVEAPTQHRIAFAVSAVSDPATAFVLDTTETPSGIAFNPVEGAAATVKASTPGPLPTFDEDF